MGKIRQGRQEVVERIPEAERKGIAPTPGISEERQAREILEKILKNDVQKISTLPGNVVLKKMGLEVDDKILKAKNLPPELKEFFGEIKDPFYTVASTIAKQGALITEFEMLARLAKLGKGTLFFDDDICRAPAVEAFRNSFKAFSKGGKDKAAFEQYLDYTRRGIVGTNTIIGELADLGAKIGKNVDITGDLGMKSTIETLGSGFGKLRRKITDTYMAEDDFWKIYNYSFEQGSYTKAFSKFYEKNNTNQEGVSKIMLMLVMQLKHFVNYR